MRAPCMCWILLLRAMRTRCWFFHLFRLIEEEAAAAAASLLV